MSRETLQQAVDFAKKGQYDHAFAVLRPLVRDERTRPAAVAALAFCHQRAGNLSTAKYLFGEACRLQPANNQWSTLLARCEEAHQKQVSEARAARPVKWPLWLAVVLLVLGVLVVAVAFSGPQADLFYDLTSVDATEVFLPFVIGGGAVAAVGFVVLLVVMRKRLRYRRSVREAEGEDFSDKRHAPCWACGLRYLDNAPQCPYCDAPRTEPPPMAEAPPPPEAGAPPFPPPAAAIPQETVAAPPPPTGTVPPPPPLPAAGTVAPPPLAPQPTAPGGAEPPPFGETPATTPPPPPPPPTAQPGPFGQAAGPPPFGQSAAPQTHAAASAPARRGGRKGGLIVLVIIALLAGGGAAAYFLLDLQYPAPLRKARSLYGSGRYADAYTTVKAYVEDFENRTMEEALGALESALEGKRVRKVGTTDPHPEAFFLMGQLGLHHRAEVLAAAKGDDSSLAGLAGTIEVQTDLAYPRQFERAATLDAAYKPKIAAELEEAIEDRLAFDAEAAGERIAAQCKSPIENREYESLHTALQGAVADERSAVQDTRPLIGLLRRYDPERAEKFEGETVSAESARKTAEAIHVAAILQMAPELTASLNSLTPKHLETGRELRRFPYMISPALKAETLDPRARDLFAALHRAYHIALGLQMSDYQGFEMSRLRRIREHWQDLVRPAVAHDELAEPLIEGAKQDGTLALTLVQYTPGAAAGDRSSRDAQSDTQGKFSLEVGRRIHEAVAEVFSSTAVAHATEAPGQDYVPFCRERWPHAQMDEIAEEQVGRIPQLLRGDDYFFAVAWTSAHVRTRSALRPHTLAAYLQRFPQGRHAAIARQFLQGNR